MNLEQAHSPKLVPGSIRLSDHRQSPNPKVVLKELLELLEEYGPLWYTEDLHNRINSALAGY